MTPEDMAALHAECFTVPRPWNAQEFADILAAPGHVLTGDADGFALGRVAAGEAELLTIAVRPERRRAGLGRQLLTGFEHAATRAGAGEAFLEVAATNAAARALYDRAGYAQVGRRPGYFCMPDGSGIDALVLRKPLQPG